MTPENNNWEMHNPKYGRYFIFLVFNERSIIPNELIIAADADMVRFFQLRSVKEWEWAVYAPSPTIPEIVKHPVIHIMFTIINGVALKLLFKNKPNIRD